VSATLDVRGVLDYVPRFRGKTFILDLMDGGLREVALAEVLLDVAALHGMGVRLVALVRPEAVDGFFDEAVEREMKVARCEASDAASVLERGQVALVAGSATACLSSEAETLALLVEATKVLAFVNGDGVLQDGEPVAAVSQSDVDALLGSDKLTGADLLKRAAEIVRSGVRRVHVLDGRMRGGHCRTPSYDWPWGA